MQSRACIPIFGVQARLFCVKLGKIEVKKGTEVIPIVLLHNRNRACLCYSTKFEKALDNGSVCAIIYMTIMTSITNVMN